MPVLTLCVVLLVIIPADCRSLPAPKRRSLPAPPPPQPVQPAPEEAHGCSPGYAEDKPCVGPFYLTTDKAGGHAEAVLLAGQGIDSRNSAYRASLGSDGNFVIYRQSDGAARWNANSNCQYNCTGAGSAPWRWVLQADGNIVRYSNGVMTWSSGSFTSHNRPFRLVMQDNGNLVLYNAADVALWASDTAEGADDGADRSLSKGTCGTCTACVAGTYKDVDGSAPCSLCPQGKYSADSAATNCDSCPAYAHSPSGSRLLTNCTCFQGYTGADGVECTACVAGKYKEVNGSSPCALCSQGKYSPENAEISESRCQGCPAHTSSGPGSSELSNCTCFRGYAGADGVECTACVAGAFKDTNGSSPCSLCLRGKYSSATAATSEATCSDCPAYTHSSLGSSTLTACTCVNGYTGPDGAACAPCIAGTYKNVNGSAACTLCSQGKYSTGGGGRHSRRRVSPALSTNILPAAAHL